MTIQLHDLASAAFLIADSGDRATQVRRRLEGLDPRPHLVIRRSVGDQTRHYLIAQHRYLTMLAAAGEGDSLHLALDLDRDRPVPALDIYLDARQVPDRCVVLEGGWVVGFVDKVHPPVPQRGLERMSHGIEALLDTELPTSMTEGETASLLISLSPDEETFGAPRLPCGETIDVVAVTNDHFAAEGMAEGRLEVSEPPALPLRLKLRAIKPGSGRVRILAFHRGICIGQVFLSTRIAEQPDEPGCGHYRRSRLPLIERPPDLSLWLFERPGSGNETLVDFRLSAADAALDLNMKPFGTLSLGSEPHDFVHGLYESIEELWGHDDLERELEVKGARLFELVLPKALRAELWALRDRVRYVQIQSDEPWIPWEICRLWGRGAGGRFEEESFLCESFAVTRWRPGIGQKLTLSLRQLALVVADSDLPSAPEELRVIKSLAEPSRIVREIRPTVREVERALMSGRFDGIHFVCHGSLNELDLQVLHLGHQERLTPGHITGIAANLGEAVPIVFLNACSSGRTFRMLNTIDGWAQRFLSAGCGAFLGSYWAAEDKACLAFTQAFYDGLVAGKPISDAVHAARQASRREGGSTWLAYTVYAHPLATLHSSSPDPGALALNPVTLRP